MEIMNFSIAVDFLNKSSTMDSINRTVDNYEFQVIWTMSPRGLLVQLAFFAFGYLLLRILSSVWATILSRAAPDSNEKEEKQNQGLKADDEVFHDCETRGGEMEEVEEKE